VRSAWLAGSSCLPPSAPGGRARLGLPRRCRACWLLLLLGCVCFGGLVVVLQCLWLVAWRAVRLPALAALRPLCFSWRRPAPPVPCAPLRWLLAVGLRCLRFAAVSLALRLRWLAWLGRGFPPRLRRSPAGRGCLPAVRRSPSLRFSRSLVPLGAPAGSFGRRFFCAWGAPRRLGGGQRAPTPQPRARGGQCLLVAGRDRIGQGSGPARRSTQALSLPRRWTVAVMDRGKRSASLPRPHGQRESLPMRSARVLLIRLATWSAGRNARAVYNTPPALH